MLASRRAELAKSLRESCSLNHGETTGGPLVCPEPSETLGLCVLVSLPTYNIYVCICTAVHPRAHHRGTRAAQVVHHRQVRRYTIAHELQT